MPAGFSVTGPPLSRNRQSADAQFGVYTGNSLHTHVFNSSGKLLVPVAGPDGTACEVIQVSAPNGGKVVTFDFIRFGMMPLVPGPETSDPNVVYLGGSVHVEEQLHHDGLRKWYRVSGHYSYGFLKPVFTLNGIPFGVSPLLRDDPATNVLPPEAFVDTMRPLTSQTTAGSTVLPGNAGTLPGLVGVSPGDDVNRLRKLVPKKPRP